MTLSGASKAVTTAIPAWIWGNDPAGLLKAAGLHGKKLPGEPELWRVYAEETYFNRRPKLVTAEHLAGPTVAQPQIERLSEMAQAETVPLTESHRALRIVEERLARARDHGAIVDFLSAVQLHTFVAEPSELASVVAAVYESLRAMPLAEDPTDRPFQNSGLHVVRRSTVLYHRAKIVSILVRLSHDALLQAGDLSQARIAANSEDRFFSSSDELYSGIVLFDAYLAPLYGALTPAIWCIHAHRELGSVVYSLGRPLAGTQGEPAEPLQLLLHHGPTESIDIPEVSPSASSAAIDWWTRQLSELFAVTTDPAVFSSQSRQFEAMRNLRALLSIEQLFRRVGSLQAGYRDSNAQRVLMFTVLDTLETITARNFDLYCTYSFAAKTLDSLRSMIPEDAAEILLPGAERAVAALLAVQSGFFLPRQVGVDWVEIPAGDGFKRLTLELAAAQYIKMLRDATHGHGTNRSGIIGRVDALLAHHSGTIPHDLPLLGYLYLLDVLANPAILRKTLSRSSGR